MENLIYEDELPEMTDCEYERWFLLSKVVYGVRMGPSVKPLKKETKKE